jgi:hypothetical protein
MPRAYEEHRVELAQRGDVHFQILALLGYHYLFGREKLVDLMHWCLTLYS